MIKFLKKAYAYNAATPLIDLCVSILLLSNSSTLVRRDEFLNSALSLILCVWVYVAANRKEGDES